MEAIEYPNQLTIPENWAERNPKHFTNITNRFDDDSENGDIVHLLSEWERVGDSIDDVIRAIYDESEAAEMPYIVELECDDELLYQHRAKTPIEAKQQVELLTYTINSTESEEALEITRMKEKFSELDEEKNEEDI